MNISWEEINSYVYVLIDQIKNSKIKLDYIYGIPRGGLILAVMLSHALELPFIDINKLKKINKKRILLCDEISDSGKTFIKLKGNEFITCAFHVRYNSKFIPDFYNLTIEDDEWVVYPWEN